MKNVLLLMSLGVLGGCMSPLILPTITPEQRTQNLQRWQSLNCSYDQGYEQGHGDGSRRHTMQGQQTAAYCPKGMRSSFMRGYREGYASAGNTGDTTVIVIPPNQSL